MTSTHLTNGAKRQALKDELSSLHEAITDHLETLIEVLDELSDNELGKDERNEFYEQAEMAAGDLRTELAALDVIMPKLEKISPPM
jgi:hypothetical protein